MLARAERTLVEREPDLPGLGLVLDDARFCERLTGLLPDEGVRAARAVYMRYKPRTSCLVAYRVLARDGELDVHAVARARGARDKLGKARERAARRDGPPRLFVLEDPPVMVAAFPEDAELRVLARLAAPGPRRRLLGRLLGRDPGTDDAPVRLRYKPERRWVGRLTTRAGAVVVKAYAPAGFEGVLRGSRAWRDQPPLRVPRLLGARPERAVLALEWIAGRALGEALLAGEAGPREVALAGEALACLHRQPAVALPRTASAEADRVTAVAAALGFVQPNLAARADRLGRKVSGRLAAPPLALAPTHGDFHAGQVLIADGSAALIDLDEAALGEPEADLASFVAHLERHACAGRLSSGRADALRDALLEGYARKAALPSDGRLVAHTAAALFRIAPHFFRERDPEWPQRTEAVLDRIEALLRGPGARAARPAGVVRRA
jgi:aminoglycoside phosphotransferase (APT) family kinase protein